MSLLGTLLPNKQIALLLLLSLYSFEHEIESNQLFDSCKVERWLGSIVHCFFSYFKGPVS